MAKIEVIDGRAVKTYSEEELKDLRELQKKIAERNRKKSSNKKYQYPRGSRGGRSYRRNNGGTILMGEEKENWKLIEKIVYVAEYGTGHEGLIEEKYIKEANKRFIDFLEAREKSIEVDRHTSIREGAKQVYGMELI